MSKLLRLSLFMSCMAFSAWSQADAALLANPEVGAFIDQRVQEDGMDRTALEQLFTQVQLKPSIISILDRPSTSRPWFQFRPNFVNTALSKEGLNFWVRHEAELARAEQKYGVPPEIIIAILGVETRFGRLAGSFRVVDALSTIAFGYPRRADYFKGELRDFLRLAQEEGGSPLLYKGSYAGAMGWPQFMPSSFRKWAVDFDGDGHRDIWNNSADAIGSIANYLKEHGWQRNADMVVPADVKKVTNVDVLVADKFQLHYTIADLRAKGVVPQSPVPNSVKAVVFPLETQPGVIEYWLGLENFYVITRYNKSTLYAKAVGDLAGMIREAWVIRMANKAAPQ